MSEPYPRTNPVRSIRLDHATLTEFPWGCTVVFHEDGAEVGSVPHPAMQDYRTIASRCGYALRALGSREPEGMFWQRACQAYCVEHEFAHLFVWQELYGRPSLVLRRLADKKPLTGAESAPEEFLAQGFQRWIRDRERPIVGGVPWGQMRDKALALLEGAA